MNLSLQIKISAYITTVIVVISAISTYLFISAHQSSIEKELISRGATLSYSLSKASMEGLLAENINLITNASFIVQAKDVVLSQVYQTTWDAVDAYPIEKLRETPHPDAVKHFKESNEPLYIKNKDSYEFYSPVVFKHSEKSNPLTIGFVRIILSSSGVQKAIEKIVVKNITVSGLAAIFVIAIFHILISNVVVSPIKRLNKSIVMFKKGVLPETTHTHQRDEIGKLFYEFQEMSRIVKERERMLVASEKRIKSIFERVEHAIFRLDSDCNIIEANSKFNNMFGNAKRLCDIFIDESDSKSCLELASFQKCVNVEVKAVSKGGDEIILSISLHPDVDTNGNITGFDGYMIDITEKKKLEERLAQSQKMEAIGNLAGGIAHDFNNMLQGILGYASLLKMNLSEKDSMYKPIDIIEKSAINAANLTKQLLGFARKGKYIVSPMSLNSAVENIFEVVSRTFDKAIQIRKTLIDNLYTVEADKSQIEHIILNLCMNAKDAMPVGGILHMETFNFEGKPIPSANHSKYAVLKVSDTGIGMDKSTQSKIFEPFFTTKEQGKGTGMGLAMVYGVVKNHGGFINVYSEVGKGSTFIIYLPAIEKMAVTEKIEEETIKIDTKGSILMVDDEEIVRDIGRSLFERLGYNVLEASDGWEALEIYKNRQDDILLIILDLIMPKMNGKETFIKLKEINPEVNVLVSSGFSIDGAAMEIINLGAKGFIQKPYNINELAKQLKEFSV
jgi:PAS domain S-box-containing protein